MVGRRREASSGPTSQLGVRARLVLVAVVVVLLALLAGGGGLVLILQMNLENAAQSTASARASEVEDLIQAEGVSGAARRLNDEARSGQFVQIIARADRTVLGASNRLVAGSPMSTDFPAPGQSIKAEIDIDNLGESGDWMVVASGLSASGRDYVIQVAIPVHVQRETVQTVAVFLLGATPLLLAGVAAAVWLLVGRALSSVERIRREVATIDSLRLAQRVEVPPSGDEIAALASTMNVMLDRLESADVAQRSFVSDASHELRSPLSTLITAAELATDADERTRTELLRTITAELARVRTLVQNLMTLARADAHALLGEIADVDLDDLVDAEARRLQATSDKAVVVALEPVRVFGDEHRLSQALRNLVDNAERHARSSVRLTLTMYAGDALAWIDNDGPLVTPADRERIFERFVRLDESRSRDAGGSGLGLPISRRIVESHGGELTVLESSDGWCRFQLRLPLPSTAPGAHSRHPQAATRVKLPHR